MMNDEIISIKLTPVFVPFKKLIREVMDASEGKQGFAMPTDEPWQGGEAIICQLTTKDDHIGLSENLVWLPETGVSPNQIIDAIQSELYKYILGKNPFNIEQIRYKMDNNVSKNEVAKALLDIACYDLMGQITGRPAYDFMGGKCVEKIPLTALIGLGEIKTTTFLVKSFLKSGYKSFRIKLGRKIQEDVEIIEKVRDIVGPDIRLRVDYNQAYSPLEAVRSIKAIEPFGIELVEQPINKNNLLGLVYIQNRVDTPLFTHESFYSIQDFITLVELKAVGAVGVNAEKPGGITNAIRVIIYAEQRGLGTVIHTQPLGIGSAMHIHLATARYNSLGYAPEIFPQMYEDDLIEKSLISSKGTVDVPEGPGWGVKLDEKALEKYATRSSIIIER